MNTPKWIAVIGAGMSGLTCARTLSQAGHDVVVFEKSRGVGGRMASRRIGALTFDHGAQHFAARHDSFKSYVAGAVKSGHVAPWSRIVGRKDESESRYVGLPKMNEALRPLSNGMDISFTTKITEAVRESHGWLLLTEDGAAEGPFDVVVSAMPAPQAVELFKDVTAFSIWAKDVYIAPCLTAMLAFEKEIYMPTAGIHIEEETLFWAARNSAKPGRRDKYDCWVLHASSTYSEKNVEMDLHTIGWTLFEALKDYLGTRLPDPLVLQGHRWRYAQVINPAPQAYFLDKDLGFGACGDWCLGPQVESAYLSGLRLARALS